MMLNISIGRGGNLELWDEFKNEIYGLVQLKDMLALILRVPYNGFTYVPSWICIYHPFQDDDLGSPQEIGVLEWCPESDHRFRIDLQDGTKFSFSTEEFADLISTKMARKFMEFEEDRITADFKQSPVTQEQIDAAVDAVKEPNTHYKVMLT